MTKKQYADVGLDDLMDAPDLQDTSLPLKPVGRGKALGRYLGAVAATALAVGSLFVPTGIAVGAAAESAASFYESLPSDVSFFKEGIPQHTVLLDRNGVEFARVFSENRQDITLDQVAPVLPKALVASEDARFYSHGGTDPVGIVRALVNNVTGGSRQGGSTLTQQLVQNMLVIRAAQSGTTEELDAVLKGNAGYIGKLKEARLAAAAEKEYSKDQILTMYLNTVYFGHGAYGIKAASLQYFGIDPSKLDASQSAVLVAMVQSPNAFNPIDHPEAAKVKRDQVLGRMLATGAVTQPDHDAALAEEITTRTAPVQSGCASSKYALYCEHVLNDLRGNPAFGQTQQARDARFAQGGLTITTALDPAATDKATEEMVKALGTGNRVATASATVEPGTGKLTVLAQSRPYGSGENQTEIVYGDSKFSVGSSFKPFTIATALEQGRDPKTTVFTSPSHYFSPTLDSPPTGFSNYGFYDYGPTDMVRATQISMNTYFVKLEEQVGVRNVAAMARRLGVTDLPELSGREGSLTLGAYELTPIEMATAYATFASGGLRCDPVAIVKAVETATQRAVDTPRPNCQQVITPSVAYGVSAILKENFASPGTASKAPLADGREGAGKTGTTENYAETWFVGYTPQLATAVWIGDPRGGQAHPLTSVDIFGRTVTSAAAEDIAAPMWRNIMNRLLEGAPKVPFPAPGSSAVSSVPGRTVPSIEGMDVGKAATLLRDAGFNPAIDSKTGKTGAIPAGIVISQRPAAGSPANEPGETVTLQLSPGSDTTITIPKDGGAK